MAINQQHRDQIDELQREFLKLKSGKENLLEMVEETELPESVFNSNAIENSTLTLEETEKIILEQEIDKDLNLREVYEAKNLARVSKYVRSKAKQLELSKAVIQILHDMLLTNIDDDIAGRFRQKNEYVRIGNYIAPAPEHVERMVEQAIIDYAADTKTYFLEKISKFHLEFERIHPFVDGNGRIGRILINYLLITQGFPTLIIRDKEKEKYYDAFKKYEKNKNTKALDRMLSLRLIESFHKRLAYLRGYEIIPVVDYAESSGDSVQSLLNKARRQTIPAFREKGSWMIGVNNRK